MAGSIDDFSLQDATLPAAYRFAGQWRICFALAAKAGWDTEQRRRLAAALADELAAAGRAADAAAVLLEYLHNVDSAGGGLLPLAEPGLLMGVPSCGSLCGGCSISCCGTGWRKALLGSPRLAATCPSRLLAAHPPPAPPCLAAVYVLAHGKVWREALRVAYGHNRCAGAAAAARGLPEACTRAYVGRVAAGQLGTDIWHSGMPWE